MNQIEEINSHLEKLAQTAYNDYWAEYYRSLKNPHEAERLLVCVIHEFYKDEYDPFREWLEQNKSNFSIQPATGHCVYTRINNPV